MVRLCYPYTNMHPLFNEIFGSVHAFDHHLRVRGDKPAHYHEDMPRNAKGYKVTALWDGER